MLVKESLSRLRLRMKTLIIGADGQLGSDLCKVIPQAEQIPLTISDIDITNKDQTVKVIKKYSPDIVINTAAYNDVNNAEVDPKKAFEINRDGAKNVAEACKEIDAVMVHISTDYVFDGEKGSPYTETDTPNPLSEYAKSKLEGEEAVKKTLDKYFIVRTSGLYGVAGCMGKDRSNFVEKIIANDTPIVVDFEHLSPTYTLDLAKKINQLIKTDKYGLFHIVNQGGCSWYQFACKIFQFLKRKNVDIVKIKQKDFVSPAPRPRNSIMKNAKLKELGMDDMRSWNDALKAYLTEKGYLKP
jgi:dTDP-4-dehydrorhamnose reductase